VLQKITQINSEKPPFLNQNETPQMETNFIEISVCVSCHCVFMLNGRGAERICQVSLQRRTVERKINMFPWLSINAINAIKGLSIFRT